MSLIFYCGNFCVCIFFLGSIGYVKVCGERFCRVFFFGLRRRGWS